MRIIFTLMMLMVAPWVWANPTVQATVEARTLSLKETSQLRITISGSKSDVNPPNLPAIDGLETQYFGPEVRMSFVNGQYSNERSFVYNIFPTKVGKVEIPSLEINVDGTIYKTEAISIDVISANAVNANDQTQSEQKTLNDIKDRIFMSVSIPYKQVFLSQKVPLKIKLYVSALPVRNVQFPKIDPKGFRIDPIGQPPQYQEVVNGVKYDVVDFNSFIYPSQTGELSIGPISIEAGLIYQSKNRSFSGDDFFGDDIFNRMFNAYQQRPITVTSEALKLQVMPWPNEGKPDDFSGAVGKFDFDVSVSPARVQVGDPVTLRMKVNGDGNLKGIQLPSFSDPAFKTYDPQIKQEDGALISEQVLIPTSEKIKEVPAVSFSYLDALSQQYQTISKGPFALEVGGVQKADEFKAVGFSNLPNASSPQIQPVDYVQRYVLEPWGRLLDLMSRAVFWLWAFVVTIICFGTWWAWRFVSRIILDPAHARRSGAIKNARRGLRELERAISAGSSKEFYMQLMKLMGRFLNEKYDVPEGAVSFQAIETINGLMPSDPVLKSGLIDLFDRADAARYATQTIEPSLMRQDLETFKLFLK